MRILVGSLVLAAAGAAMAAAMGAGTFASLGEGRILLPGSGIDPVAVPANFRFSFDGAPADTAGTGVVSCFDETGLNLLDQFPFTWNTKRGASFRLDLASQDFADFLGARIAAATGGTAELTLERATGKGVRRKQTDTLPVKIQVRGGVSLDGADPIPLKAKLKLR